jgi:hypothetical protein
VTRPLISLVIVATFHWQDATAAELTVRNVKVGTVLHGPPVSSRDLDGAVIFVEEWGIH